MKTFLQIAVGVVLITYGVRAQGSGSGSSGTSGSGLTCAELACEHYCNASAVVCYCDVGYKLQSDGYSCEECEAGTYGINCESSCADNCGKGRFSSCDPVNGTCECNSCWALKDGNCTLPTAGEYGYSCFLEYLESPTKELDEFGNEIPVPHEDSLIALARHILEVPGTAVVVQSGTERLEVIDRSDVGARPLGRFSFSVDNPTSTDTMNGIETLRSRVKTGDYYSTLIIDESSGDETKVTVNV